MPRLATTHQPSPAERVDMAALTEARAAQLGHRPLSDHLWIALAPQTTLATVAALARSDGALRGFAIAALDGDEPAAQIVTSAEAEPTLTADLLGAVTAAAPGVGWLVFGAEPFHDHVAAAAGLTPARAVVQMRRRLPIDTSGPLLPTRPFRVGMDEDAWLRVNARAFAGHPDQGGWDRAELAAREAEPWFDPDGFLLHERDGELAGFCWTKVHSEEQPPSGEIYVIAVDPAFHGHGLGRALTVAGLRHMERRGITEGMLFVDGDNVAALGLYESLGFTRHRVDRVYLPAAKAPTR